MNENTFNLPVDSGSPYHLFSAVQGVVSSAVGQDQKREDCTKNLKIAKQSEPYVAF